MMTKRQLGALFFCNLVPYSIGGFIMPLLPIYLNQLGANAGITGLFLSVAFLCLAAGALISGWLSNRFQRRKQTIFLVSLISIPMIFLMGQANSLTLLLLAACIVWFSGGLITSTVAILAGMYAEPGQRGRVFGAIGLSVGIGSVLGGFGSGLIVDHWGFPALYTLAASFHLIELTAISFVTDDQRVISGTRKPDKKIPVMHATLWLFFAASIMIEITSASANLSRPLGMYAADFNASAISGANAMTGLITLPLPYILGGLSDRLGRKPMLVIIYGLVSTSVLILIGGTVLWHFWLSAAILGLVGAGRSVGSALVTDLSTQESLATAMSRFSATPWLGSTIGYALAGMLIEAFGLTTANAVAFCAAGAAILLLTRIKPRSPV